MRRPEAAPQIGGADEIMIFVRSEGFYPVQGVLSVPLWKQAADHAALNPGTIRVEDARGRILWQEAAHA